jgi:hypothetical protein
VALGQKRQYSSRLRFKAGPTLNWLAGCAIYNLSVSLLGCCATLWSFLVQIGRVFSINRPDEAFGMSGQPGQNGGDAWQILLGDNPKKFKRSSLFLTAISALIGGGSEVLARR